MAVLIVVALAALGVFAATASANGGTGSATGVTCTWSIGAGTAAGSCTKDGKTLSCSATFSWAAGLRITCTLPDGTVRQVWPR
jgi:hypothetical protein